MRWKTGSAGGSRCYSFLPLPYPRFLGWPHQGRFPIPKILAKGLQLILCHWGPSWCGRAAQRGAQISCQAVTLLLGLSLAGVPQIFQEWGKGAAASLTLWMGQSHSRGQEGSVAALVAGPGVAVAPLFAIRLGREVPVLPALPAHPEPLGQRLVLNSFADLGSVILCLANK